VIATVSTCLERLKFALLLFDFAADFAELLADAQ